MNSRIESSNCICPCHKALGNKGICGTCYRTNCHIIPEEINPSTIVKKVKALPWEKLPDYLIYEYRGKTWVYKVNGTPMTISDTSNLLDWLKKQ